MIPEAATIVVDALHEWAAANAVGLPDPAGTHKAVALAFREGVIPYDSVGPEYGIFRGPIHLYRLLDGFELAVLADAYARDPDTQFSGGFYNTAREREGGAAFGADRDAIRRFEARSRRLRPPFYMVQVEGEGRRFHRLGLMDAVPPGAPFPRAICDVGLGCSIRPRAADVVQAWTVDPTTRETTPGDWLDLLRRSATGRTHIDVDDLRLFESARADMNAWTRERQKLERDTPMWDRVPKVSASDIGLLTVTLDQMHRGATTARRVLPGHPALATLENNIIRNLPPALAKRWAGLEKARPRESASVPVPGPPAAGVIVRPVGWQAANDVPASWTKPGRVYRGMTSDEFEATVGAGRGVRTRGDFSHPSEGTPFSESAADAESYVNFGRDDPRATGRPTYMVEIADHVGMRHWPDGYWKTPEEVSRERIRRVWRFDAREGAVVATDIMNVLRLGPHNTTLREFAEAPAHPKVWDDEVGAWLTAHDTRLRQFMAGIRTRFDLDPMVAADRDFHLYFYGGPGGDYRVIVLRRMIIPKDRRVSGVGTAVMRALTAFADEHKYVVWLSLATPDDGLGTTSRARLLTFYKRFGFHENKGRYRDYASREEMIRRPRAVRESADVVFESVSDDLRKWALKDVGWAGQQSRVRKTKDHREFVLHWIPGKGGMNDIVATRGDQVVGNLFYGPGSGDAVLVGAVEVHPAFRRKGIASAMYTWAEALSGGRFVPDTPHTPYAQALWGQPNRRFGRISKEGAE